MLGAATLALGATLPSADADDPPAVSPYTYSVGTPIDLPPGPVGRGGPYDVAVDPLTHTVYAANYDAQTVDVIDGSSRRLSRSIAVGSDRNPRGIAVDPGARKGFVVAGGLRVVSFDLVNNSIIGTVASDNLTGGLAVDTTSHRLFVTRADQYLPPGEEQPPKPPLAAAGVTLVDSSDHVAVDQATHTVFATLEDLSNLDVINPATGSTTSVTVGRHPVGVAVDSSTGTVYTANRGDGTLSVVDESTRTVTRTIPVCPKPAALALDPGTHTVYVTCLDPAEPFDRNGTVAVVDAATGTVTHVLPAGRAAISADVDPTTHTLWIGNYNDGTVMPITQTSTDPGGTRGAVPPVLRSSSSRSGPVRGGQQVTLTGRGFTGTTQVSFGTASATFRVVSDTSITLTTPAHARRAVTIRVRNPAGSSTGTWGAIYVYR